MHPKRLQNDTIVRAMRSLHVRDVPDEVHQALMRRAKARGVSLRRYLIELLTEHVSLPTMDEWLASLRELEPASPSMSAAEGVRLAREERDDQLEQLHRGRRRR